MQSKMCVAQQDTVRRSIFAECTHYLESCRSDDLIDLTPIAKYCCRYRKIFLLTGAQECALSVDDYSPQTQR